MADDDLKARVLHAVSQSTGQDWEQRGRLAGGFNEGALLVRTPASADLKVLKIVARDPVRVLAARPLIDHAVAMGWPSPGWRAAGRIDDVAWVLQDYIEGQRPSALSAREADGFIGAFEIQRGLGSGGTDVWGVWAAGVVFEDWDDHRDRTRRRTTLGGVIVDRVDEIARRCRDCPELSGVDLVHGNATLDNTIDDGTTLWLVDAVTAAPGPIAYDLAELILTSAHLPDTHRDALDRLWVWGAEALDPRHLAVCLGSLAFTVADAHEQLRTGADPRGLAAVTIRTLDAAIDRLTRSVFADLPGRATDGYGQCCRGLSRVNSRAPYRAS